MKIVEQEGKHKRVLTEKPDWRFHFDPGLALREVLHRENGGVPRLPEEVAKTPVTWDEDLYLMSQLLQFQRDALDD